MVNGKKMGVTIDPSGEIIQCPDEPVSALIRQGG